MKIRDGFVSNSSSSSFCIYGAYVDVRGLKDSFKQDLFEFLKKEWDVNELDLNDYETGELAEAIASKLGMDSGYNYDGGDPVIGLAPGSIPDEETMGSAKDRVKVALESAFKSTSVPHWCKEAWFS